MVSGPDIPAQTRRQRQKASVEAKKQPSKQGKTANGKTTKGKAKGKAETSADVKKKQQATQKEIQQTKEQIEANKRQVKKELAELSRISSDVEVSAKRVSQLDSRVMALTAEIGRLEKSIEEGEAEVARMRGEYLKAVKKMRLTTKNSSALAFIFSADSFNQGLRRMRYMREFSKWKDTRSKAINSRIATLKEEAVSLEKARKEQAEALTKQRQAKNRLETQRQTQDGLVKRLKTEGDALHSHLAQKQAEANRLKSQIASLIAQEERKAAEERRRQEEAAARTKAEAERKASETEAAKGVREKEQNAVQSAAEKDKPKKDKHKKDKPKKEQPKKEQSKNEKSGKPAASGSGFASMKGSLPRPVEGTFRITSPFGRHSLPELPDVMYDNPGIDVEVSAGATAKAVYGGTVSGVYMIPGFGNVVIVSHGNHYTVYGNLSSVSVKTGDEVNQGQGVGRVGADADNPKYGSLHFEVWRNRDKLDPASWIR